MDRTTYKALQKIMALFHEPIGHPLEEEVEQVLAWMDDIENS